MNLKNTYLFLICLLFTATLFAQSKRGSTIEARLGIGVLPGNIADWHRLDQNVIPLGFDINYRTKKGLSLGLFGSYTQVEFEEELLDEPKSVQDPDITTILYQRSSYTLGLRAAAHYQEYEKWDFYGGLQLGYRFSDVETLTDLGPGLAPPEDRGIRDNQGISYSAFVGLEYLIKPHWGVYSELGFGQSLMSIGVSWRFQQK